jgi:uncharacterized protein (TIGR03790 family)
MQTLVALLLSLPSLAALAGGSGLNVVVVVNQASSNSVALGNYYCERRGVPPQNLLRINWTGGNQNWSRTNFETALRSPLEAMLAARQLTNQIEYVLLCMDLPYRVDEGYPDQNSTTSALFYGYKPDSRVPCVIAPGSSNAYAGSEGIFRQTPPISAGSNSWLVMMLTGNDLAAAKRVVDQGVASDGTFPSQTVWLAKSTDAARNVRYQVFDNTIFDLQVQGGPPVLRTNSDSPLGMTNMLGYQNGLYQFTISPDSFVPGAMADSLTSYGGGLFDAGNHHTKLLAFLAAGAAGSYGTVIEPCAYLAKFPDARNYFYQSRGFSLAECYYLAVTNPYQGLLVGEPLAAPFARSGSGAWVNLPPGAALTGTTNLALQFAGADAARPLQQVDLFVDGRFVQTLTNLAPLPGNVLYVSLPGRSGMSYTVPASATLKSVATGLAAVLNLPANRNTTKVAATARGDRIGLSSEDLTRTGAQTLVSVSNSLGTATALTTHLAASRPGFLDTDALGRRAIQVSGTVVPGDYLQLRVTKTNGVLVTVAVTNTAAGATLPEFVQSFMDLINAAPGLLGLDGVGAEDLVSYNGGSAVTFNLRARAAGVAAAQAAVLVSGTLLNIAPTTQQTLTENLADLQPRNHLYLTAGLTNLNLTFAFNSTLYADGAHELTAVAYEGTHVRTQTRVSQTVVIRNLSPFSAQLTPLVGDTNIALEATLQFAGDAVGGVITRLELFSTGGLLGVVSNQPTATFSVAATNLGVGLHPFYLVATRSDGKQFRTGTRWIRIVGAEAPFKVTVANAAPTLTWPANAGRQYSVLSATNPANSFTVRGVVTPTNSAGLWSETNRTSPQRFYRVKTP